MKTNKETFEELAEMILDENYLEMKIWYHGDRKSYSEEFGQIVEKKFYWDLINNDAVLVKLKTNDENTIDFKIKAESKIEVFNMGDDIVLYKITDANNNQLGITVLI